MEFAFRTEYDPSAVVAMAKALRKTVRKKRSNRAMILGIFVVVLAILFSIPSQNETFVLSGRLIITWLAAAAVIIVMIWQDQINGLLARKRMLPGTNVSDKRSISGGTPEEFSAFVQEKTGLTIHNI